MTALALLASVAVLLACSRTLRSGAAWGALIASLGLALLFGGVYVARALGLIS